MACEMGRQFRTTLNDAGKYGLQEFRDIWVPYIPTPKEGWASLDVKFDTEAAAGAHAQKLFSFETTYIPPLSQ